MSRIGTFLLGTAVGVAGLGLLAWAYVTMVDESGEDEAAEDEL